MALSHYQPSLLASDAAVREKFLAALRRIGTVAGAARETGVAETTARRQRKRDTNFDLAWTAICGDKQTDALEAALLDRATNGIKRKKTFANGTVEEWTEFDNGFGIALLKLRDPRRYGEGAAAVMAAANAAPAVPAISRAEFIAAIRERAGNGLLARASGDLSAPLPLAGGVGGGEVAG